jgi:hypothetical protein
MALLEGFRLTAASIRVDHDSLGRVMHRSYGGIVGMDVEATPRHARRAQARIRFALAGIEAERMQFGQRIRDDGAESDYHSAAGMALRLAGGDPREAEAWLALLRIQTQKALCSSMNWAVVAEVARELLERETLTGREIRDIWARCWRELHEARPPFPPAAKE